MWILTQDKKHLIEVSHLAIAPSQVFPEDGLWDLFVCLGTNNALRLGTFASEWEARTMLETIYHSISRGAKAIQIPDRGTLQYDQCGKCGKVIDKSLECWQWSIEKIGTVVCGSCYEQEWQGWYTPLVNSGGDNDYEVIQQNYEKR